MSSAEFYDNFISYQIESGLNDRIFSLYRRLCKIGLSNNLNILELGCGIGCLTYLLSRKIKKGKIEAVDISPKSIEYAKYHLKKPNLNFSSSDLLEYVPKCESFDKILLFDVLEHIPIEKHNVLFEKLSTWMNEKSRLLINLPNAHYILYDQKNNPGALQETDQPIFIDKLAHVFAKNSLDIEFVETYSIWVKDDYHFIVAKKHTEFKENLLSTERSLIKKTIIRLTKILRKIIYHYPIQK